MKKKRRKAFWSNIKFKYRLTITNENTLEDIITLRVSKLNGLSVLLSVLFVLFLIASLIVAFTPLRNYLPGYMNSEIRAQVVENALRVDSLQQLVNRQNLYIMNIQDIFQGKIKADTIHSIDSLTHLREDSLMERTQREAEFRKQYEETEKYNLTSITARPEIDGLIFYRPTRGMISSPSMPKQNTSARTLPPIRAKAYYHLRRYRHTEYLHCRDGLSDRNTAQPGLRVSLQALRLSAETGRRCGERG